MKLIKLKPINERIAIATPTEEEAKELLAILHANGHKWNSGDSLIKQNYWYENKHESAYSIKSNKGIGFSSCTGYKARGVKILSLAEFKRMYCQEEKPQPKFKVDDCVINKWGRIIGMRFHEEAQEWEYNIKVYPKGYATAFESNLSPCAEHETKDETKDETKG